MARLQPFDTSTEAGRSSERYRRALLNSLSGAVARGTTILTALLSVPLTIGYLGNERYGLWLTISSVFAFAFVADLGVTQGVQNLISAAHGRGDEVTARRSISTALGILLASTAALGVILLVLYPIIPWPRLFAVESAQASSEAGLTSLIFGFVWLANILLALVIRVNTAYQDGFVNNLWQALGSGLALGGVLLAIRAHAGLPVLVLALTGAPALATLINGLILFGRQRPQLRPSLRLFDRAIAGKVLRSGGWFLLVAIGYQIYTHVGYLIIAHMLGPEEVAQFGIPARVASVLNMLIGLMVIPLWPAYVESLARGDRRWALLTLKRSVAVSFAVAALPAIALVVGGRWLVHWWVGPSIDPTTSLLGGLACWLTLLAVGNALHAFLLAVDAVRFIALGRVAQAITIVPLQFLLVHWLGLAGVAWALFIVELVCLFLPAAWYCRRLAGRIAAAPQTITPDEPVPAPP